MNKYVVCILISSNYLLLVFTLNHKTCTKSLVQIFSIHPLGIWKTVYSCWMKNWWVALQPHRRHVCFVLCSQCTHTIQTGVTMSLRMLLMNLQCYHKWAGVWIRGCRAQLVVQSHLVHSVEKREVTEVKHEATDQLKSWF